MTTPAERAMEMDCGATIITNLAAMLRRMIWYARKQEGDTGLKVVAGRADELLRSYGLEGDLLRVSDIQTTGHICARLRTSNPPTGVQWPHALLHEAATEIERLQFQVNEVSADQVQSMVDVWREWTGQTPGLRSSVNDMMRRAYLRATSPRAAGMETWWCARCNDVAESEHAPCTRCGSAWRGNAPF